MISARKAKHLDVTTMFTYSHTNTPLGQSERAYPLSYFINMYGNIHSEGTCVLLEIPSMHKLVQYFQTLYRNEDIYELKGVHIANFEVDLFSSSVEYCSISNVNSYQCSCKQRCTIAVYTMCYSVIDPCGYWTSGTLSALVSNRNTLYNVMDAKRHIMPVDLPRSVSIRGAEINLTVWAVSTGVLCCNLTESMSALKRCIFAKHCYEVTGFLLWIGTYCISCVVEQRTRVKELFSLVGYGDSCLVPIRHVKRIMRVVQPRPYIRSHSVLLLLLRRRSGMSQSCFFGGQDWALKVRRFWVLVAYLTN